MTERRALLGLTAALALAALAPTRAHADELPAIDSVREQCRALVDRGARADAIAACERAVRFGGSARDMRMLAAAFVARPEAPTLAELFRADLLARAAVIAAPQEPWGYAAHVDVARRWGDDAMVARRLQDLERVAPQHDETLRARAALARPTPWLRLLGLTLVLLAGLATLVRAVRAVAQRRTSRRVALGAVASLWIVACLAAAAPRSASAATPAAAEAAGAPAAAPAPAGKRAAFEVDDANPEASIPEPAQQNARPLEFAYLLQTLGERAMAASKAGQHDVAARYYRALAKAVPDRAISFARLCQECAAAGQQKDALDACRVALTREGVTVDDYVRFVRLALARTGALTPADVTELEAVTEHVVASKEARAVGYHLQCTLALRIHDLPLLETCTAGLTSVAPKDPKTLSFRWSLAVEKGQAEEARRLVGEARAAGVAADAVERMDKATAALAPVRPRFADWRVVLPIAAALVAAALVLVRARRKATPESA